MQQDAGRPPVAWRAALRLVMWVLRTVRGWQVQARPPERVPRADQPLVVVFNHTSAVDAFVVAELVWRRLQHWVRPLVKAELHDAPVFGEIVRRAGAIPVRRAEGAGREVAYADAVDTLQAGGTILIAPEGTTTHDGSLLPLRHGAARLALQAGVDVLVVTHFGAQRGFSPVVRLPERDALVTVAVDLLSPLPDEDATALTGRIAATMLDRSEELRATYPQADPQARWWPPYAAPASPTATAKENLERYRQSMAEAVAQARERMAQVAEEHPIEQRVTQARERITRFAEDHEVEQRLAEAQDRASAMAEDVAARSRARAEQTRDRVDELTGQTRERFDELSGQTRERVEELAEQARERASHLVAQLPTGERRRPDGPRPDGPPPEDPPADDGVHDRGSDEDATHQAEPGGEPDAPGAGSRDRG